MDNQSDDALMRASASMRGKSYHQILAELILRLDRLEETIRILNREDNDHATD